MEGSLTGFSLKEVFEMLGATAKTGILEVTGVDEEEGRACFRDGLLYWACVQPEPEDLSEHHGRLKDRIEDSVFEIFEWDSDTYRFNAGETIDKGSKSGLKVDTVLVDVSRRRAEWAEIRQEIPSMSARIGIISKMEAETVTLTRAQWEILAAVGHGSTVEDIRLALNESPLGLCRTLCEMSRAGLIRCLGEIVEAEPVSGKATKQSPAKTKSSKKYISRSLIDDEEKANAVPAEWASYYQLLDSRQETIQPDRALAVKKH